MNCWSIFDTDSQPCRTLRSSERRYSPVPAPRNAGQLTLIPIDDFVAGRAGDSKRSAHTRHVLALEQGEPQNGEYRDRSGFRRLLPVEAPRLADDPISKRSPKRLIERRPAPGEKMRFRQRQFGRKYAH